MSFLNPAGASLSQQQLSLDHEAFVETLAQTENLLIIQDLDGVCMALVNDPLTRRIHPDYVNATRAFDPHFYVLTNGEHSGRRGVNRIVENAFIEHPFLDSPLAESSGSEPRFYLPGLAAGGVQWQRRDGLISHPGVSPEELAFLQAVPGQIEACLRQFFHQQPVPTAIAENFEDYLAASILDNAASPTANLNQLYGALLAERDRGLAIYIALQKRLQQALEDLLQAASQQGLKDSFFIHYAPNLGRNCTGKEQLWLASEQGGSGTTDFQFMLKGAIKEAGVLVLLNHYYFVRQGHYPLGADFNARQAPHDLKALAALAEEAFGPAQMPKIIGVGDTVTAQLDGEASEATVKRGGSDRNFLQLVADLNGIFKRGNLTVYVDSSGGELKNRQPLEVATIAGSQRVVRGPGDADDPLRLNVAFPGGHQQYCETFIRAARRRAGR